MGVEIFAPPSHIPSERLLRRDRIATMLALALLTALAWSYLLWLSADMFMGGMDMRLSSPSDACVTTGGCADGPGLLCRIVRIANDERWLVVERGHGRYFAEVAFCHNSMIGSAS
jgi:predicted metal-binding membrane protein